VSAKDDIKNVRPNQILSEVEYFNLSSRFGQIFTAGIGTEAIRKILENGSISQQKSSRLKGGTGCWRDDLIRKKTLQRLKVLSGI
jgi:DNA-directed RNA polymerase subunit beta'